MPAADRPGEFETIARLLRPLATDPAARGLADDAAVLAQTAGSDLVLTHDMIVEGVHFLPGDPLDLVARKLLRVNLSDLAAKGAEPVGYVLGCAWSARCGWPEREAFARGLAEDQARFGLALLGGDTVSTPGPLTLEATLLGRVPAGGAPSRAGARPGDVLLVSGTIGDGWLGLAAAEGRLAGPHAAGLAERYRLPRPRLELRPLVRRAHACADVSDGLVADAGRIADASGIGLELALDRLPLSEGAIAWLDAQGNRGAALARLATGGDDYELALAVVPEAAEQMIAAARDLGAPVAAVGRFGGEGLRVAFEGRPQPLDSPGWSHG